jgi:hypothetical protein
MCVAWLHYMQYYCINMLKLLLSTPPHYDLLATGIRSTEGQQKVNIRFFEHSNIQSRRMSLKTPNVPAVVHELKENKTYTHTRQAQACPKAWIKVTETPSAKSSEVRENCPLEGASITILNTSMIENCPPDGSV